MRWKCLAINYLVDFNNPPITNPPIIAIKNMTDVICPKDNDDTAGPGQNPTTPQPMPNNPAPTISSPSKILRFFSIAKLEGLRNLLFFKIKNIGDATIIAENITKMSDGSQFPNTLKKDLTFSGFVISEITKPNPKIDPEINTKKELRMRHPIH